MASGLLSQMNNLVSLHKILVCENEGKCLTRECFLVTRFFTPPIILDVFYIPNGDCQRNSYFGRGSTVRLGQLKNGELYCEVFLHGN